MSEIEGSADQNSDEMLSDEQRGSQRENSDLGSDDVKKPGLITHETERAQIGYTPDFKEFIRQNPHTIKNFLEIEKEIASNPEIKTGAIIEQDGVRVELIHQWGDNAYNWYKVQVGEAAYFVKADKKGVRWNTYEQVASSEKARKALEKNPIPGVRVEDFQLGFTKGPKRYFVSKWFDGERLDHLLNRLDNDIGKPERWWDYGERTYVYRRKETRTDKEIQADQAKRQSLLKRIEEVKKAFPTYGDVSEHNMFYDGKTDELVWFDIYE